MDDDDTIPADPDEPETPLLAPDQPGPDDEKDVGEGVGDDA